MHQQHEHFFLLSLFCFQGQLKKALLQTRQHLSRVIAAFYIHKDENASRRMEILVNPDYRDALLFGSRLRLALLRVSFATRIFLYPETL